MNSQKMFQILYWKILPHRLRTWFEIQRQPKRFKLLRTNIIRYLSEFYTNPENPSAAEVARVINYLKRNPLSVFPYPFEHQFPFISIMVYLDSLNGMHYVLFQGKRLYFKRKWHVEQIQKCMSGLLTEQYHGSPHRYTTEKFDLVESGMFVDVGAAEGIFTLEKIEKVNHAYLFESDPEWEEPLKATFNPWIDKVTIINKPVSSELTESAITLDSTIPGRIDFLKIDVEGMEKAVLEGTREMFRKRSVEKVAICCYHHASDEKALKLHLNNLGFETTHSEGFMIFIHDSQLAPPYLRRGLLRATLKS